MVGGHVPPDHPDHLVIAIAAGYEPAFASAAGLGIGGTELAAAVRAGRQLTRLAPLRESGYRYLMQALAAQGNLAEALGVYSQLCECLRDQLGVSPSPATRELYQRLLAAT